MVQVIQDELRPQPISMSYVWWKVGLVGTLIGLLWWLLLIVLKNFVVDPLFCKSLVDLSSCSNSMGLSGNISSILSGTVGLGVLVRLRVLRPIIIALATSITLWGLVLWVDGLSWWEVPLWSALLHGLTYILYSWIGRYTLSIPVMLAVTIVVIITRIAVAL